MKRTIQQRAFDGGYGARAAHDLKANPYQRATSPSLWECWERGWRRAGEDFPA